MMRGDKRSVHHDEACRERMTEALKATEQGRKRIEDADSRGNKYFEKLGEKITAEEERKLKRMRTDEGANGDPMSASCGSDPTFVRSEALASSSSGAALPESVDQDMQWQEFAENLKNKKRLAEETEKAAKRQAVEEELDREKMEIYVGELDLIEEPSVWDQYEA